MSSYIQAPMLTSFPGLRFSLHFFFLPLITYLLTSHAELCLTWSWKILNKNKILLVFFFCSVKLPNWDLWWESKRHFVDRTRVTESECVDVLESEPWAKCTVGLSGIWGLIWCFMVEVCLEGWIADDKQVASGPLQLLPVWLVTLSCNNVYCCKNGEVHVLCNFDKSIFTSRFRHRHIQSYWPLALSWCQTPVICRQVRTAVVLLSSKSVVLQFFAAESGEAQHCSTQKPSLSLASIEIS